VAKQQPQPFLVEADNVTVKAVGTAFNVRLRSENVEVLVTEGRVEIDHPQVPLDPMVVEAPPVAEVTPPALPLLIAGQRMTLPKASLTTVPLVVQTVTPEAMREELAWQGPRLVFVETPLAEVVKQFNRRNRVQMMIADVELEAIPVGGSFRPDSVEAFVRLVANESGLAVERPSADRIVLRKAR